MSWAKDLRTPLSNSVAIVAVASLDQLWRRMSGIRYFKIDIEGDRVVVVVFSQEEVVSLFQARAEALMVGESMLVQLFLGSG